MDLVTFYHQKNKGNHMKKRLGSWQLPTNNVEVFYTLGAVNDVYFEWDQFPPAKKDAKYYEKYVLPQVTQKMQEIMKRPGPTVVINLK